MCKMVEPAKREASRPRSKPLGNALHAQPLSRLKPSKFPSTLRPNMQHLGAARVFSTSQRVASCASVSAPRNELDRVQCRGSGRSKRVTIGQYDQRQSVTI